MDASRAVRAWRFSVLGALTMFGALCIDLYLPAFPQVAEDLNVPVSDVALTLTTFMVGMGIGQIIYGPLSDRFGRKIPLISGIVIFIVATVMCAVATSLPVLILWRFVQALGASAGVVISRAMLRDFYSGIALAQAMTLLGMIFVIGPALAPSLGSLILLAGDWHTVFVALAIFGAVILLATFTLPESHPLEFRNKNNILQAVRSYGEILKNKTFLFSALILGADFGGFFGYVSVSPDILMNEYGLSTVQFALVFGAISLSLVVGGQINIRLLPRFGVLTLLRLYTSIQVVASFFLLVSFLLNAPLAVILGIITILTTFVGAILGNSLSLATSPFAHLAASASAMAGLFQMVLAGLVAALLTVLPYDTPIEMSVVMLLFIFIAAVLVRSRHLPHTPLHQP